MTGPDEDQPQCGQLRLGVPTPPSSGQHQVCCETEAAVTGFAHVLGRDAKMNINWYPEPRGDLKDRSKLLRSK